MPSKVMSSTVYARSKDVIDALQNDTTFTDRQKRALQNAAMDLYNGLDANSFTGKTVTITGDAFNSTTAPSMSISVAFT